METKDLAKKIGAAARAARKARRWSQADAAEQIGISSEFYARIERGQTMPSTPTLVAMGQALDVSLDVLTGRVRGRTPSARPKETAEESPEMRRLMRRLRRAKAKNVRLLSLIAAALEGSR